MSFLKNITSKDLKLSQDTIKNLITTVNIEQFEELASKSEFIFPFLKERIAKDFVKLINKENLGAVFEFSKIYCADFEDLIINSWLKFASEDLTDEILEIFENGTKEQMAYAALYFSHIKDSLALEYLNKFALSDFEPLKTNCACALKEFGDSTALQHAKEIILNSDDDFEILNAFGFINAYSGKENIEFVIENCFKSPFVSGIISNLLDFNDFQTIRNCCDNETLIKIFAILIEAYPEDISLDTVLYYQIYDYIKEIYNFKNSYSNNILLMAKAKFIEFNENEIYSFDLDKNTKEELKKITQYLNSLELNFAQSELDLYESKPYRYNLALDIIKEYKLIQYAPKIADEFNEKRLKSSMIAKSAMVLKDLDKTDLIDKNIITDIKDDNIRAIVENAICS